MLEKYLKILDKYRSNISNYVDMEIIEKKQNELNVKFPQSMIDFYIHFGNDKDVLSSFYVLDNVEDIRIENEVVIFGEKHEGIGCLGIQLEDLNTKSQTVCWYSYDSKEWYVESGAAIVFFFNTACWQILNTMPSIAKVNLSNAELEKLIGNDLSYLSEERLLLLGDVITVTGHEILGCYLLDSEELYLGAMTDEILEEYEELLEIDLDWL